MSAPTPNTATERATARLLSYYEAHPDALDHTVDNIVKHFEFEHHLNDVQRMFRVNAAMQRHPAGKARTRECTPAAWSPAPDPIHWEPRMSSWDIVRDLVALAWKTIRR
ncbi:hypothetical protein FK530_22845 [Tsukamurella conjunctivitidis]|uniref:Uncharacterized protein n=1 Tax=Tsukamurella conjunctivitidis TaxID=2592068 RepID=A0A5C5RTL8_9ACTN|nr:hypothetical protein [Tsukamurella conjunctivitidis]TWS25561.1 hypothetical protein FK530_22845 [Tsukamurella conjunctivitidis]